MRKTKKTSLTTYLRKYSKIQKDLVICHRPNLESGWSNRCKYLDEKYDPFLPYNHRSILENEVVIEFDNEDKKLNRELAQAVANKLSNHKIPYSLWFSGGKSTHLHFFIQTREVRSLSLLKRSTIRYFTKELEYTPDLQLTGNHLIRAEYGIHEKTGEYKELLAESRGYPKLCTLPIGVWDIYNTEMSAVQKRQMTVELKDIEESEILKKILDTVYVKEVVKDGRSRLVAALSQILKHKYSDKNELINFIYDWYRYTDGKNLTRGQVAYQVYYAYNNPMDNPLGFLFQVAEDLGIELNEEHSDKDTQVQNESRKTNG